MSSRGFGQGRPRSVRGAFTLAHRADLQAACWSPVESDIQDELRRIANPEHGPGGPRGALVSKIPPMVRDMTGDQCLPWKP